MGCVAGVLHRVCRFGAVVHRGGGFLHRERRGAERLGRKPRRSSHDRKGARPAGRRDHVGTGTRCRTDAPGDREASELRSLAACCPGALRRRGPAVHRCCPSAVCRVVHRVRSAERRRSRVLAGVDHLPRSGDRSDGASDRVGARCPGGAHTTTRVGSGRRRRAAGRPGDSTGADGARGIDRARPATRRPPVAAQRHSPRPATSTEPQPASPRPSNGRAVSTRGGRRRPVGGRTAGGPPAHRRRADRVGGQLSVRGLRHRHRVPGAAPRDRDRRVGVPFGQHRLSSRPATPERARPGLDAPPSAAVPTPHRVQ